MLDHAHVVNWLALGPLLARLCQPVRSQSPERGIVLAVLNNGMFDVRSPAMNASVEQSGFEAARDTLDGWDWRSVRQRRRSRS